MKPLSVYCILMVSIYTDRRRKSHGVPGPDESAASTECGCCCPDDIEIEFPAPAFMVDHPVFYPRRLPARQRAFLPDRAALSAPAHTCMLRCAGRLPRIAGYL